MFPKGEKLKLMKIILSEKAQELYVKLIIISLPKVLTYHMCFITGK